MSISTVSSATASGSTTASTSSNASMSTADFYKIIVAQLQNQSPDDTTDSNAMVQNMMAISNYQAINGMSTDTTKLSNYSTANSLLGKTVTVTPSTLSSDTVTGTVDNVTYSSDGTASITINNNSYDLSTVLSVANTASSTSTGTTAQ
ncbi:flagellar basal-body rod modification protein FlgD [Verrucomicrobium sp. GAS474]|uniref:flagellar hook capping FlgD N-terminal domain-containing protein n=1 Tax=Verrucomicrobium sp. GAS474 TaxID=1882831 RepID=UPI00087D7BB3|nr:flagellar hook capping FlgD N-terminal domain-containing protein [Verrucomicrobium sp. GAS474]SDU24992.1 flagellar basal-body rod modification protein FlgD [Verrucomicrobium sp. GAS474]